MDEMNEKQIKELVFEVAVETAKRGPGWSQESVVMRELASRAKSNKAIADFSRMMLDAWHDLFSEKRLGWGSDLETPNSPFFHVR